MFLVHIKRFWVAKAGRLCGKEKERDVVLKVVPNLENAVVEILIFFFFLPGESTLYCRNFSSLRMLFLTQHSHHQSVLNAAKCLYRTEFAWKCFSQWVRPKFSKHKHVSHCLLHG